MGDHGSESQAVFGNLQKAAQTPSTVAKVLPWVKGVEMDDPPEGMFGPYDSQPPTRPQTLVDTIPPPQPRSIHPFARQPYTSVPFSALGAAHNGDAEIGATEVLEEQARTRTRQSEVLSRGAGMPVATGIPVIAEGEVTPGRTGSAVSMGMGTFGNEPSLQLGPGRASPTKTGSSPRRPVPTQDRTPGPPPTQPLPVPPRSTATTVRPSWGNALPESATEPLTQPHVHHPHPEYPFSPEEAAHKQAEAMQAARAEALAHLEAAAHFPVPPGIFPGPKGLRETYQTSTSGPSFGHILHHNGRPIPPDYSFRTSLAEVPSSARQNAGLSGGSFFRIPFGVPLGTGIPRPLVIMRSDTGLATGLGVTKDGVAAEVHHLGEVDDQPERKSRKDDRSAFVETIPDEQDPALPAAKSPSPRPRTAKESTMRGAAPDEVCDAARASSQIRVTRPPSNAAVGTAVPNAQNRAASLSPETKRVKSPSVVPSVPPPNVPVTQPPPPAGARSPTGRVPSAATATQVGTATRPVLELPEDDAATVTAASPRPLSVAPTTASNVKQLVAESKFHDETLCQLLDAARLNLIGDEAKKALNRAARARVIELKDMRMRGDMLPEPHVSHLPVVKENTPEKKKTKSRRSRSRDSHGNRKVSGKTHVTEKADKECADPPPWAQEIIHRLSAFETRFTDLEKHQQQFAPEDEILLRQGPDPYGELVNELLFRDIPGGHFGPPIPDSQFSPFMLRQPQQGSIHTIEPGQTSRQGTLPAASIYGTRQAASAPGTRAVPSAHGTVPPRSVPGTSPRAPGPTAVNANGEVITWGSEVEMPNLSEPVPKGPPTIHVQAPTDSNLAKSDQRVFTPSIQSRTIPRSPSQAGAPVPVSVPPPDDDAKSYHSHKTVKTHPTAVPDPIEKDLPPQASESIRSFRDSQTRERSSHKPSQAPQSITSPPLGESVRNPASIARSLPASIAPSIPARPTVPQSVPPVEVVRASHDMSSPTFVTAPTRQLPSQQMPVPLGAMNKFPETYMPQTPERREKDIIHVVEGSSPSIGQADPWDLVTQRLYSWALVWEDESFVRALEKISLGQQVEEFPLTIFTMMTFKRLLRHNLTSIPVKACDKLYVPPNMAQAINNAVHSKHFTLAQQILEELWYPFGFDQPPRVIVALTKHRQDLDHWTAHRYDLTTGRLTTYSVHSHEDEDAPLADGRPFMWWHAIRAAWPGFQAPPIEDLRQRVETFRQPIERRMDNSLIAANIARNLLMGYRPEREGETIKMRELIWTEVKRLLQKKRSGRLVVDMDSSDHVYEL